MSYEKRYDMKGNPLGALVGILLIILGFLLFIYLTRIIVKVLLFITPFLFIASLIIDHTVFLGYVKWIGQLLRRNLLAGIGVILLSVLLYPLTASFLFAKAYFRKKMKQAQQEYEKQTKGELIDFEEIVDEEEEGEALRLPHMEKERRQRPSANKDNDYDDLFL